ncbi:terpene cyclase/mutase family protein, partial [bacterium]|nr:terpene cyclase/mutase family protein [bacterium]
MALASIVVLGVTPSPSRADTNAVTRGLTWLAAQQNADGAWSTNVALNALPLLAFLSAGHVPAAIPGPADPWSKVVERGLRHVLTQQGDQGEFTAGGAGMYGHGITALLLAEAAGMTSLDPELRPALQRAVDLMLRSQAVDKVDLHAGGWRYEPGSTDSDLSVTVWQVLALKAAHDAGVSVPQAAISGALAYLRRCEHPQGGFGYQPGGLPNVARSAAAVVALRVLGQPDDQATARSLRWIKEHPLDRESPFYYYALHYAAHANDAQDLAELIKLQQPDGSWPALERFT